VKAVIANMTAQCALYLGALKFSRLPDYAHSYYSQNFSWAFVPIDPTKFEVRSFTRFSDKGKGKRCQRLRHDQQRF